MRKYICSILAVLMLGGMLVSCGSGEVVMTFGESYITENQFAYWLSSYKGIYLYTYSDMQDTAEYYRYVLDNGMTVEEYLFDATVENISMTLVCSELFRREGLVVPESVEDAVDEYINSLIQDYGNGNKNTLNAALAEYGVNIKMLREICLMQEINDLLFSYLYGSNGTQKLTDADKTQYYEDNYCRIRHIYVNNSYSYATDEDGYYQTDEEGNYILKELSDEEAEKKNAVIDAIETAILNGESFEDIYHTYSEDQFYENGYYLTRTMDFIPEVVDASFTLEVGEVTRVDSRYGVHFLMRLPLDEGAYDNASNADFFEGFEEAVKEKLYMDWIDTYLPEVVIDHEALSKYSVEEAAVNNRF